MLTSFSRTLVASFVLAAPVLANPSPGGVQTIADRLTALDRFTSDEDASGVDAFRFDRRNWYDFDILFAAVLLDETLVPAVTDPATAVTLFAPNDRAFQLLAYDLTGRWFFHEADVLAAIVGLVESAAVDLTAVLTYHVVDGKILRSDVPFHVPVPTLNGETLLFQRRFFGFLTELVDSTSELRNPFLLDTDLGAGKSVVHEISRVLIPVSAGG